jgi:hypothetical protein
VWYGEYSTLWLSVAVTYRKWFSGHNLWTVSNVCSFISTLHFLQKFLLISTAVWNTVMTFGGPCIIRLPGQITRPLPTQYNTDNNCHPCFRRDSKPWSQCWTVRGRTWLAPHSALHTTISHRVLLPMTSFDKPRWIMHRKYVSRILHNSEPRDTKPVSVITLAIWLRSLQIGKKVKWYRYTPWRRMGCEEV